MFLLYCLNAIDLVHGVQSRGGASMHVALSKPESFVVKNIGNNAREALEKADTWLRNFAEEKELSRQGKCFWYVPKLFFEKVSALFRSDTATVKLPVAKITFEGKDKELSFLTHVNEDLIKLTFTCLSPLTGVEVSTEETSKSTLPAYFLVVPLVQGGSTSEMEVVLQLDETKDYAVVGSNVVLNALLETQKSELFEEKWQPKASWTNTTESDGRTTYVTLYSPKKKNERFDLVYAAKCDSFVLRAAIKNAVNWATYNAVEVNYSPTKKPSRVLEMASNAAKFVANIFTIQPKSSAKWKTCLEALLKNSKQIRQSPLESAVLIVRMLNSGRELTAALLLCGKHKPVVLMSSATEEECQVGLERSSNYIFIPLQRYHFIVKCPNNQCYPEVSWFKWRKLSNHCPKNFAKQKDVLQDLMKK